MENPFYTRKVQIKNHAGEVEEHELHSNSIMDLDAQYFRLVRESEIPPAPKGEEPFELEIEIDEEAN